MNQFEKLYSVDENAAEKGKWLTTQAGMEVMVAKLGNKDFTAEVVRLQKPFLALLRSKADTSELINKITVEAMAKTILMDWKTEVPYSWEDGKAMMLKYPDFREDVSILSAERDNFKPEEVAEK